MQSQFSAETITKDGAHRFRNSPQPRAHHFHPTGLVTHATVRRPSAALDLGSADVVIGRGGKPVALLTRLASPKRKIRFGLLKGREFAIKARMGKFDGDPVELAEAIESSVTTGPPQMALALP